MHSDDPQVNQRLQSAVRFARQAGVHTLNYFQRDTYQVSRKADGSPVTQADQETEALLRELITAEFPEDGIIGEEFPAKTGTTAYRWILDPIDGTKSFISGVPLYGTLIAVQHNQQSVIGIIEMPALDEQVFAATACGAWHVRHNNPPQRANVANDSELGDGLLLTSEFQGWMERGATSAWEQLATNSWFTRTWGDCYGYLLVATGRALAMIDPQLNIWDAAAVQVVIQEAGGRFTDWQGREKIDSGDAIGANSAVLDQILAVTRDAPPLKDTPVKL